ncbi:hypothetical protein PMAYCL1PPCAC_12762, partial [Pristionchus mayeri]
CGKEVEGIVMRKVVERLHKSLEEQDRKDPNRKHKRLAILVPLIRRGFVRNAWTTASEDETKKAKKELTCKTMATDRVLICHPTSYGIGFKSSAHIEPTRRIINQVLRKKGTIKEGTGWNDQRYQRQIQNRHGRGMGHEKIK